MYIIVPTRYLEPGELSHHQRRQTFIRLSSSVDDPSLLPSRLTQPVFANLTIGYLAGQGDASDGCPSRIDWSVDNLGLKIIAWCAANKVSSEIHPSPTQLRSLASSLDISPRWGADIFRLLINRTLGYITNHVSTKVLPNALVRQGNNVLWKEHTRGWSPSTLIKERLHEISIGFRNPQASLAPGLGLTRIVNALMADLRKAGVFDIDTSSAAVPVQATVTPNRLAPAFPATPSTVDSGFASATPSHEPSGRKATQLPITPPPSPLHHRSFGSGITHHHTGTGNAEIREALLAETAGRAMGDEKLRQHIDAESRHRLSADNQLSKQLDALGSQVSAETRLRTDGHRGLSNQLKSLDTDLVGESRLRYDGDAYLSKLIEDEAKTRRNIAGSLRNDLSIETKARVEAITNERGARQQAIDSLVKSQNNDITNQVAAKIKIHEQSQLDRIEAEKKNFDHAIKSEQQARESAFTTIKTAQDHGMADLSRTVDDLARATIDPNVEGSLASQLGLTRSQLKQLAYWVQENLQPQRA